MSEKISFKEIKRYRLDEDANGLLAYIEKEDEKFEVIEDE